MRLRRGRRVGQVQAVRGRRGLAAAGHAELGQDVRHGRGQVSGCVVPVPPARWPMSLTRQPEELACADR
jgi:hypothetical protein